MSYIELKECKRRKSPFYQIQAVVQVGEECILGERIYIPQVLNDDVSHMHFHVAKRWTSHVISQKLSPINYNCIDSAYCRDSW